MLRVFLGHPERSCSKPISPDTMLCLVNQGNSTVQRTIQEPTLSTKFVCAQLHKLLVFTNFVSSIMDDCGVMFNVKEIDDFEARCVVVRMFVLQLGIDC